MLSCKNVRAALPGIEAGEHASGALRDHLATCEGCRAVAARLRADLAVLREDLAVLAPSPFLEDAVVEAARATGPAQAGARRGGLWLRAGIAAAAAALLVGVLLVARNGGNGGAAGPGEEDGAGPLAWFPPSACEVAFARDENPPRFDHPPREDGRVLYRHWYMNREKGLTTYSKKTIDPAVPGIAHRWVVAPGEAGDRTLVMVGVPPRGAQVLGKALLDRVGGERALTGFKEHFGEAGAWTAEIEVGAPGAGGATARIEVVLRPDYGGTLLLEEPLARALGLYQFEIPGTCRIEGDLTTAAHRARARVRIQRSERDPLTRKLRKLPDLEEVVEVQVRVAGDPPPAPTLQRAEGPGTTLRFEGERPDGYLTARSARIDADSVEFLGEILLAEMDAVPAPATSKQFVEAPVEGTGPLLVALDFRRGAHPACRVLLPHLDRPDDWPHGYRFDLERVTLAGDFEPGAQVVVGRVWRGATAIPSRESVALTTVGPDGSVSFVRQAGEAGGRLRMRVQGKGDRARWADVHLARKRLLINLTKDGSCYLKNLVFSLKSDPAVALGALRDTLKELVGHHAGSGRTGHDELHVLIAAEAEVPWRYVQWVMQTCGHPAVGLRHLRFQLVGRADAPLRNDLPEDRGLEAGPPPEAATIRVVLTAKGEATRYEARWESMVVEGAVGRPGSALAALREGVRRRLAAPDGGEVRVELAATPPLGGTVPYADVVAVIQALQDAGAGQILFVGAAIPR